MLEALGDHHPARLNRAQLATLAKMRPSSGTYSTYLSDLRTAGYIGETDHLLELTPACTAALGRQPTPPMTAAEVYEQWRQAMRAGARRMLDTHDRGLPRADHPG